MKTPIEHLRNLTDKFRKRTQVNPEAVKKMEAVIEAAKKASEEIKAQKE